MDLTSVPPLAPGCPWYEVGARFGLPNIKWCEENVCGWVVSPALTWSNLGFLVAGVYLLLRARRVREAGTRGALGYFFPAALGLGLTSLLYHASYNYPAQVIDFAGMYLYLFLLLVYGLLRAGWLPRRRMLGAYVLLNVAWLPLLLLLRAAGVPFQLTFLLSLLAVLGFEVAVFLRLRGSRPADYRWFFAALGTVTVAMGFSALDVTRTWCEPGNHVLQGHAVWHLLCAVSLLFAYRFYAQFSFDA
jgi:hypothetical protein